METKSNINVKVEGPNVVIRTGEALPLKEPKIINLDGSIVGPVEFVRKRKDDFPANLVHLTYSIREMFIKLVLNENSYYSATVRGSLKENPELVAFGINKEAYRNVKDLQKFLRLRKYFFVDPSQHAAIIANLSKFNAEITSKIKDENDNRGKVDRSLSMDVKTDIPLSFDLSLPIFLGQPPKKFKVDICFEVRDTNEIVTWLESTELQELVMGDRENLVFDQVTILKDQFNFVAIEV